MNESRPPAALASPVPAPSRLPALRHRIRWIDEESSKYVDFKEPAAAGSLAFFTGGFGDIYNRRFFRGLALLTASLGTLIAAFSLPPLFLVWAAIGIGSAVGAVRDSRAINRFVLAREKEQRAGGRLLAAMTASSVPSRAPAAEASSPFQETLDRLRQISALHGRKMLNEVEFQNRKIDIISGFSGVSRDRLDALLYALVPLVDEGTLNHDDIEFAKSLGDS